MQILFQTQSVLNELFLSVCSLIFLNVCSTNNYIDVNPNKFKIFPHCCCHLILEVQVGSIRYSRQDLTLFDRVSSIKSMVYCWHFFESISFFFATTYSTRWSSRTLVCSALPQLVVGKFDFRRLCTCTAFKRHNFFRSTFRLPISFYHVADIVLNFEVGLFHADFNYF